jgi:hypothetical protein
VTGFEGHEGRINPPRSVEPVGAPDQAPAACEGAGKPLRVERLAQEREALGDRRVRDRGIARDEKGRQVRVPGPHLAGEVETRHAPRHDHVRDHHVEGARQQALQGGRGVRHQLGMEAKLTQVGDAHLGHVGIVLDDEGAAPHRGSR